MAKKEINEITKKIVVLDNKSRKGTYTYIKEKGKQGRYYKLKTEEPTTIYEQYYKDKYQKRRKLKGTLQQYKRAYLTPTTLKRGKAWKQYAISTALKKQAQQYLKTIQKRPSIHEAIKEGLTQVTINNIHKANPKIIQAAHKQLLQDLIIDKKLLEIITTPENTKKLANRYENRIIIKDKQGKTITTATKYNTTPEQVINELKKEFKPDNTIEYIEGKLKKLGYQTEGKTTNFTIGNIDLTITFRKGKSQ